VPHPVTGEQEIRRQVEEILEDLLPLDVSLVSSTLCHYTSLSVTLLILEKTHEDIFLSECRYCNDREEFTYAFKVAIDILASWPNPTFAQPVATVLQLFKQEAYVFCLCEPPADRLSQWRGYGADGRGTCISFDAVALLAMTGPGFERRLVPVKYYDPIQTRGDLTQVIQEGQRRYYNAASVVHQQTIIEATALALYYLCPVYKDPGFTEECEWRLLYMPLMTPAAGAISPTYYRDRNGFLIPYVKLSELARLPTRNVGPGLPIEEIMVGPSGLIDLNEEALTDLVLLHPNQHGRITITRSTIPYRP
jgi:hypothetical protein